MKRLILSLVCLVPCLINSTAKADKNWDGDGSAGNFDWWNNWYGDSDPYAGWGFGTGSLNFNYQNNASATGLYNNCLLYTSPSPRD